MILRHPLFFLIIVAPLFSACSPTRFFYYPNKKLYVDPEKVNLTYEMMRYPSENGKNLFALLFRTNQTPKGLAVHFHGNFGNVSNHFLASSFLVDHGFDVLIFDYQGYGGSEGRPSPKRTVEDGVATLRFARSLSRTPNRDVVVLAQSLGVAAAIPAIAAAPDGVRGAVFQAGFSSYRSMSREVLKRSWITWPLYPVVPWFIGRRYDPDRYLEKLPPIPLLFVHGGNDEIIPVSMTRRLFEGAKSPKELWLVEGADHNRLRQQAGERYDRRVSEFFTKCVSTVTSNN